MSVDERTGSLGSYYGSNYSNSAGLSSEQMEVNATFIYNFFKSKGWTLNAIAGLLGNMQAESSLNPGRWQSEDIGNLNGGYGLVQWTPASKYINWCTSQNLYDPSEMDNNLNRIIYELENNLQWIPTSEFNLSFSDFSTSQEQVEYLAEAFLKCYERAGVEVLETRIENAMSWYRYLVDNDDHHYSPKPNKRRFTSGFKFVLFGRKRRIGR